MATTNEPITTKSYPLLCEARSGAERCARWRGGSSTERPRRVALSLKRSDGRTRGAGNRLQRPCRCSPLSEPRRKELTAKSVAYLEARSRLRAVFSAHDRAQSRQTLRTPFGGRRVATISPPTGGAIVRRQAEHSASDALSAGHAYARCHGNRAASPALSPTPPVSAVFDPSRDEYLRRSTRRMGGPL